ncbi:MAG TPA: GNAT family N-acetyltransferase [Candidatus Megaira endosymbiont of Stentor roeselii]|nr:GNAT family N-acetyltransferase [Candidatus Megaera endosymbiont of Stentor roeselii]
MKSHKNILLAQRSIGLVILMASRTLSFYQIFLERTQTDLSEVHLANMSQVGHTISLDFGIGNKKYLGCGLGAPTLSAFVTFYKDEVDNKADTFFIDPDENNPRAIRVYNKAGFNKAGQYEVTEGCFIGHGSDLMVKKV